MRTDFNQRPGRPKRRGGHSSEAINGKTTSATPRRSGHLKHSAPDTYNLMDDDMMHQFSVGLKDDDANDPIWADPPSGDLGNSSVDSGNC